MILVSGDMPSALLADSSDHRFLWQGAAGPADQAGDAPAEEAREHPAVSALDEQAGSGTEQEIAAPDGSEGPAGPRIEILGDASAEQVAALVAVLSGVGGGDEEPAGPPSRWASRERLVRSAMHPSRGGWRASALPR